MLFYKGPELVIHQPRQVMDNMNGNIQIKEGRLFSVFISYYYRLVYPTSWPGRLKQNLTVLQLMYIYYSLV
jgi:hypothetical protein